MALNLGWSILFFGLQQIGLALVEMAALIAAIVATMVWAWRIDRLATGLLAPYAAWVCFAFALNAAIWQLNQAWL